MWRGGGGNEISLYLEGRAMLRKELCMVCVYEFGQKTSTLKTWAFDGRNYVGSELVAPMVKNLPAAQETRV